MKKLVIFIGILMISFSVFSQDTFKYVEKLRTSFNEILPANKVIFVKNEKKFYLSTVITPRVNYTMQDVIRSGNYVDIPEIGTLYSLTFTKLIVGTLTATTTFSGTVNTGQGANELYDMDQNVLTSSLVTFAGVDGGTMTATTVNTGQGANELYDMDQNVLTTSAVVFDEVTIGTETLSQTATNTVTVENNLAADTVIIGTHKIYENNSLYLELNKGLKISQYLLAADESFFQNDMKIYKDLMLLKKYDASPYFIDFLVRDTVGKESKMKLQNISDVNIQNKAGTGQVEVAERDTSGTEAKWNLKNLNDVTVSDDLVTSGRFFADSNMYYGDDYTHIWTLWASQELGIPASRLDLQNLADISLQNKAGTGQVEIIERDTVLTSEVVANLPNVGTITVYDSITTWKGIKSFEEYAAMADGGTMTLTASTAGVIEIYGETSGVGDTIFVSAHFSFDAAVALHTDCTTNVAATDAASKFCVYDSGTAVVIKNALGRAGQFYIKVKYFTPSFP